MKTYNLLLTGFLLVTLFIPGFLAKPCTAAFFPSNNITLENNGMTWEYQEQITGNESIIFRSFIDLQTGDHDKFVNAWEILNAENFLRDQMKEAIKTEPDVKLNGTSDPVKVTDVDFCVPKEALGNVLKDSSITSSANVSYIFKKDIDQGTDIWFMGTPNSNVTITLPAGFDVEKTEGLNNKSQESEGNHIVLKGNFSPEKNMTLWVSKNESSKAELQKKEGTTGQNAENKSTGAENKIETAGKTIKTAKSSEFFKGILTWFYKSPKS